MVINTKPLISVIIAVYNGEKYLEEAIWSVLSQTYPTLELLVVDDGSEDSTRQVVEKIPDERITYLYQQHAGIGAACNNGITSSHGSYISFLDADDLWVPDKLTRQIEAFENDPTLDMVFGQVEQFLSADIDEETKKKYTYALEKMPGYSRGNLLISRAAFERIGFFQTKWTLGEFIDWYLRATEAGLKSRVLPDVLMKRRLHNTNIGIQKHNDQSNYVQILKASLDRRRKKL